MSARARLCLPPVCLTVTRGPGLSCLSWKNQAVLGCGSPATRQTSRTELPGPLGRLSVSTVMTGLSAERRRSY